MGLLSGLGSLLGGDTIKNIGSVIDDLHTSGEEKAKNKQKLETILAQAEQVWISSSICSLGSRPKTW